MVIKQAPSSVRPIVDLAEGSIVPLFEVTFVYYDTEQIINQVDILALSITCIRSHIDAQRKLDLRTNLGARHPPMLETLGNY